MQPIMQASLDQKLKNIRHLRADQEFCGVIGCFGLTLLAFPEPPKSFFPLCYRSKPLYNPVSQETPRTGRVWGQDPGIIREPKTARKILGKVSAKANRNAAQLRQLFDGIDSIDSIEELDSVDGGHRSSYFPVALVCSHDTRYRTNALQGSTSKIDR